MKKTAGRLPAKKLTMSAFQLAVLGRIIDHPGCMASTTEIPGHTLGGSYQTCKAFLNNGFIRKTKSGTLEATRTGTKEFKRHTQAILGTINR